MHTDCMIEKNLEQPVIWLVAPKSIIKLWAELGITPKNAIEKKLLFYTKE
jgi:hypothetical protein